MQVSVSQEIVACHVPAIILVSMQEQHWLHVRIVLKLH